MDSISNLKLQIRLHFIKNFIEQREYFMANGQLLLHLNKKPMPVLLVAICFTLSMFHIRFVVCACDRLFPSISISSSSVLIFVFFSFDGFWFELREVVSCSILFLVNNLTIELTDNNTIDTWTECIAIVGLTY